MKKIIDALTKEEIIFSKADLPIFIHGVEHSGASLLSITLAAGLHNAGNKLCIFTAYSMAKEEFLKQVGSTDEVYYLENIQDVEKAYRSRTIIVKSGNVDLFLETVANKDLMEDRIIFLKNIETIKTSVFGMVSVHPLIVSGDLGINESQADFKDFSYNTKIFLSPLVGEDVPRLEKYQAFMKNLSGNRMLSVIE